MGARDLRTMRPGRWEKSFLRPTGRAVSGRGNWRRPELPKKDSESAGGRGGRPREPGGVEPGSLSGNGAQVPLARACQPASCVRHPPDLVLLHSCHRSASQASPPSPADSGGPRSAHSLGEAEGTTTLPQRGEGWARGRVKLSPFSATPLPRKCHSAARQRGDSAGHQAGEGRNWAVGGAMGAGGQAPTVPGGTQDPSSPSPPKPH